MEQIIFQINVLRTDSKGFLRPQSKVLHNTEGVDNVFGECPIGTISLKKFQKTFQFLAGAVLLPLFDRNLGLWLLYHSCSVNYRHLKQEACLIDLPPDGHSFVELALAYSGCIIIQGFLNVRCCDFADGLHAQFNGNH